MGPDALCIGRSQPALLCREGLQVAAIRLERVGGSAALRGKHLQERFDQQGVA